MIIIIRLKLPYITTDIQKQFIFYEKRVINILGGLIMFDITQNKKRPLPVEPSTETSRL